MITPPLSLAATTRPWAQLPLARSLRGIRAAGFDALALPVHGVADPLTGGTPAAEVRQIASSITEHGLTLTMLSHDASFEHDDAQELRLLKRQIKHCADLEVRVLVDVGCQDREHFDRYFQLMREAAPIAADHGVTIAMKSHGGLSRTIEDTINAVHRVDHDAFRVCLDPGMLIHHAGDGALAEFDKLAPYVAAVGIRDHPGRGSSRSAHRDPGRDAPGLPPAITPGHGIVDFAAIYAILRENQFTGPSALESLNPTTTIAYVDANAAHAREYLKQAMSGTQSQRIPTGAPPETKRDCTTLSSVRKEPLIGSARHFDGYFLTELDLPWPQTMGLALSKYPKTPETLRVPLRNAAAHIKNSGRFVKSLALAPDPEYSIPGHLRVMRFDLHPVPTSGYERSEYVVPEEHAPALIDALYDPDPGALDRFRGWLRTSADRRDLLVCTHGTVDACCGTYGYPIYDQLRNKLEGNDTTRVWRVSSFGGHRFAPTLIDLPDGRFWGNITSEHLDSLIRRSGGIDDLLPLYRGSGGWSHPIAQVAERTLFAHYGWSWSGMPLHLASLDDGTNERYAHLLATVGRDEDATIAYSVEIDLVDDIDVTIGCTGLFSQLPVYQARSLVRTDRSTVQPTALNLNTSVHSIRGGEAPH